MRLSRFFLALLIATNPVTGWAQGEGQGGPGQDGESQGGEGQGGEGQSGEGQGGEGH